MEEGAPAPTVRATSNNDGDTNLIDVTDRGAILAAARSIEALLNTPLARAPPRVGGCSDGHEYCWPIAPHTHLSYSVISSHVLQFDGSKYRTSTDSHS